MRAVSMQAYSLLSRLLLAWGPGDGQLDTIQVDTKADGKMDMLIVDSTGKYMVTPPHLGWSSFKTTQVVGRVVTVRHNTHTCGPCGRVLCS